MALVTTFGGDRTDVVQGGPSDNQPPATRDDPDPPDEDDAESDVSDVESAVEIPVVGGTTPPDLDPDTSMTDPPEASGSDDPPTPATLPAGPEPADMTGTPGTDPAANGDSGDAALPGGDSDVEASSNAGEDTSSPSTEDGGATDSASGAGTSDADPNDAGEPGSGGTPSETSDQTGTDLPPADESTPGKDAEKTAKKPPPKPAKKPFQDLPARAVLPLPGSADGQQPIRLGAVHIPEKEFCFVKLRGGETAMRGDGEFLLRNAENGSAERDWELFFRERDQQTLLARLSIAENADLIFRWEPAADELESTAYLVNCPLSFTCDEQSHVLSFREPTVVEALAVDLNKPALRENWTVDAAPDPQAVRVEILGLEGAEFAIEPASVLLAEDGEAWIRIQDGGGVLSLRAQTDFGRNLQLNLMAFVTYPGETEPKPLNRKQIQQARDQLATMERMVTMQVEQLRQASKAKLEKPQKNLVTSRLATFEMELTKVQAGAATIRGLEEMLQQLGGNLRLKLRVYAEAGTARSIS